MSKIRSRPEKPWPNRCTMGLVSVASQEMLTSNNIRISRANASPMRRARSRSSGGNFSAKMAMNSRLSIPSTISRTTRVNSPNQAVGSNIQTRSNITAPQQYQK